MNESKKDKINILLILSKTYYKERTEKNRLSLKEFKSKNFLELYNIQNKHIYDFGKNVLKIDRTNFKEYMTFYDIVTKGLTPNFKNMEYSKNKIMQEIT